MESRNQRRIPGASMIMGIPDNETIQIMLRDQPPSMAAIQTLMEPAMARLVIFSCNFVMLYSF